MSTKYDIYLMEHRMGVKKAMTWLTAKLPEIFSELSTTESEELRYNINHHDESKDLKDEYIAYDNFFYGPVLHIERDGIPDSKIKSDFNLAWLLHIHRNPHHWQYWVLIQDDEDTELIEIPTIYIIEMICDWWSFSWKAHNLFEIFEWYAKNRDNMQINPLSRSKIESILNKIRDGLEDDKQKGITYNY